jgi:hypothetical protein
MYVIEKTSVAKQNEVTLARFEHSFCIDFGACFVDRFQERFAA